MRRLILSVMLACALVTAEAEPNATTYYLMREPASMMDVGILRLERVLERTFDAEYSVKVGYDLDANQISVSISDRDEKTYKFRDIAAAQCKSIIDRLRGAFDFSTTGKLMSAKSVAAEAFGHTGYSSKREPISLDADIDKLVRLHALVTYQETPYVFKHVTCEAPLLGTGVLFAQ